MPAKKKKSVAKEPEPKTPVKRESTKSEAAATPITPKPAPAPRVSYINYVPEPITLPALKNDFMNMSTQNIFSLMHPDREANISLI